MVIARCCQNLDNVIADLDDGNIECAATQVIYHNLLGRAVIQTICQRSACGLIDNTQHIQAGNTTCIFGCLALRIVEISRYRDNGIGNIPTQILLGISAHFTQDHGRDFLGSERLPVHAGFPLTAHMTLNRRNCSIGIYHRLPLSDAAHQAFAFFRKGHHAGCGSLPFRIGDNGYAAALHSCHAAIGGTKIDSYCRTHMGPPYLFTSSAKRQESACISPLRRIRAALDARHNQAISNRTGYSAQALLRKPRHAAAFFIPYLHNNEKSEARQEHRLPQLRFLFARSTLHDPLPHRHTAPSTARSRLGPDP